MHNTVSFCPNHIDNSFYWVEIDETTSVELLCERFKGFIRAWRNIDKGAPHQKVMQWKMKQFSFVFKKCHPNLDMDELAKEALK